MYKTDQEDPVVTCPPDVVAAAGEGFVNGTANWTVPVPTDNSNDVTLTSTIDPQTPPLVFDIGTREVNYTATDGSQNTASCSFNVTITGGSSVSVYFKAVTELMKVVEVPLTTHFDVYIPVFLSFCLCVRSC